MPTSESWEEIESRRACCCALRYSERASEADIHATSPSLYTTQYGNDLRVSADMGKYKMPSHSIRDDKDKTGRLRSACCVGEKFE
eukprot:CAMPEP_0173066436 /NCGR_PEP_ID=MMETSP1102-20130122/6204_1 /TAXON_ID=49646 /ORGANISM="Geminigera sp., Strain Caron Lab Isolate" /LENGTH=84 /DNA_ID=CAMNT_0013933881 /DNA_START=146 /DNA_END=400 /DNA_ORIENTATION=-